MTKRTTSCTLVTDALTRADDFMTLDQLVERTRELPHRVKVTVHYLRRTKAIDAMDVDGKLYFYATPNTDKRVRTFEERKEEDRPRKSRRKKQ